MTSLFREQPKSSLERLLQAPPLRRPGRGEANRFHSRKEECDCAFCDLRPCSGIAKCPFFEDYLQAGAWTYWQLLWRLNQEITPGPLHDRVAALCRQPDLRPWAGPEHLQRLLDLRRQGCLPQDADSHYQAAVFLLTSKRRLWQRSSHSIHNGSVNFISICPADLGEEAYVLLKAAKGIYLSQVRISEDELADPQTVSDELFALIMAAFVVRFCGLPELSGGLH